MGVILKALSGSFGTYILIAVAAVFLGMAASISWLWGVRTDLLVENGALTAKLQSAQRANASQQASIDVLTNANDRWATLYESSKEAMSESIARLAALAEDVRRINTVLEAAEERDRAIPECQDLLRLSFDVCPTISEGLWQRANRGNPDGASTSPRGGGD